MQKERVMATHDGRTAIATRARGIGVVGAKSYY
jgi:hypothetical protein